MPANAVVVGVPGQIVARSRALADVPEPDLEDAVLPDLVGASLESLRDRLEVLEIALMGKASSFAIKPSVDGVWSGDDFSI